MMNTARLGLQGGHAAFVDEYGDSNLQVEKKGTTTFFIVTAILASCDEVSELRSAVDAVRAVHFGKGEMKSSSVGANDARRLRILSDLGRLPYRFTSVLVDKRAVFKNSGLAYKPSFIKFAHRQLFSRLYRVYPGLELFADEHGRRVFMNSFARYVQKNVERTLFYRPDFRFVSSKEEPLIQLADFVGGTMARLWDPKKNSTRTNELASKLEKHVRAPVFWPPTDRSVALTGESDSSNDRLIRQLALEQVFRILGKDPSNESDEERARRLVLEHLQFHFHFASEEEYLPAGRLQDVLIENGLSRFSDEQEFRSAIIAKLRDQGALIASSRWGYKIPRSMSDMLDFVQRADSMIFPLLGRIQKARESILLRTDIDILGDTKYKHLRAVLETALLTPLEG